MVVWRSLVSRTVNLHCNYGGSSCVFSSVRQPKSLPKPRSPGVILPLFTQSHSVRAPTGERQAKIAIAGTRPYGRGSPLTSLKWGRSSGESGQESCYSTEDWEGLGTGCVERSGPDIDLPT